MERASPVLAYPWRVIPAMRVPGLSELSAHQLALAGAAAAGARWSRRGGSAGSPGAPPHGAGAGRRSRTSRCRAAPRPARWRCPRWPPAARRAPVRSAPWRARRCRRRPTAGPLPPVPLASDRARPATQASAGAAASTAALSAVMPLIRARSWALSCGMVCTAPHCSRTASAARLSLRPTRIVRSSASVRTLAPYCPRRSEPVGGGHWLRSFAARAWLPPPPRRPRPRLRARAALDLQAREPSEHFLPARVPGPGLERPFQRRFGRSSLWPRGAGSVCWEDVVGPARFARLPDGPVAANSRR